MTPPDKCTQCGLDTMTPWHAGLTARRCTLCGFVEEAEKELKKC